MRMNAIRHMARPTARRLWMLALGAILMLALVMVALSACSQGTSPPVQPTATPTLPPPTVDPTLDASATAMASRGIIRSNLELAGQVKVAQAVDVWFSTAGRLESLAVSEGDEVQEGDLLAQLDDLHLQREAALAQYSLQIAQAQLEQARATYNPTATLALADKEIKQAELEVEEARYAATQEDLEVAQAELAVEAAQYVYNQLVADLGSAEAAAGSPEHVALRGAQLELEALASRPDNLALRRAQLHKQAAQIAYDRQQEELTRADLQLTILEASVGQAQLALERAQADLASSRLLAPRAGRIADVQVSVGDAVEAYQPVLTLFDPEGLEVWGTAGQSEVAAIQSGQAVSITLLREDSAPLQGRVRSIEPHPLLGSGEPLLRVIVEIEGEASSARMGDLATLVIAVQRNDVLLIPFAALHQRNGHEYVWVQRDGIWQQVEVEVGLEGGEFVEIRDGLREGETVRLQQ